MLELKTVMVLLDSFCIPENGPSSFTCKMIRHKYLLAHYHKYYLFFCDWTLSGDCTVLGERGYCQELGQESGEFIKHGTLL